MRIRLRVGLAAFLAIVAFPTRGDACSCVTGAPLCETFWTTPLVFSGTVLEIVPAAARNKEPRTLRYGRVVRFKVTQTWRGEAAGTLDVRTGMGGGDCGFAFVTGQEYLVYAHGSPGAYSTGICSRTRLVSRASEDLAYLKSALQPAAAGRIFGTATYQRTSSDPPASTVAGYTVTLAQGDRKWTTTTGGDGTYEFRGIPAGSYTVALTVLATEEVSGPATIELADPRGCATANFTVIIDGRIRKFEPRPDPPRLQHLPAPARR